MSNSYSLTVHPCERVACRQGGQTGLAIDERCQFVDGRQSPIDGVPLSFAPQRAMFSRACGQATGSPVKSACLSQKRLVRRSCTTSSMTEKRGSGQGLPSRKPPSWSVAALSIILPSAAKHCRCPVAGRNPLLVPRTGQKRDSWSLRP